MRMLKSMLALLAIVTALQAGPVLAFQPDVPPEPQDQFVPISEVPPQDQLPAAPLLITAYSIVLLVFFAYLVSLARRMSAVRREIDELASTLGRSRRE